MSLSCIIFLKYSEMLVENRRCQPTDLAYPLGMTPMEFNRNFWHQKSIGYDVCLILCLADLVELRLVTDGQTDSQTQNHSIYRASIASRDENISL